MGVLNILNAGYWNWKKSNVVSSTTGSSLTEYQLIYFVHRTSGTDAGQHVYIGTKCKEDFSDVRFYDAENNVLFYHNIEEINETVAVFCVRIPVIPTTGKTIWIIYGDNNLASDNSPTNTYEFFDQFDGASLDLLKWNLLSGTTTVEDGKLTIDTNTIISSFLTYGIGYKIRAQCYFPNAVSTIGFGFDNNGSPRSFIRYRTGAGTFLLSYYGATGEEAQVVNGSTGQWITCEISRYSNNAIRLMTGWVYRGIVNLNNISSSINICITSASSGSGLQLNAIYVTKTAATEPTQGPWSSEEEIINFSKMAKYYAIETIHLADSQLNPLITIMHEVISLSDSAIRTIHTRVLKEVIYLGDSGTGFLTHWAKEIIRLGNVAAGAFVAKETIHLHNGDDPNSQGCDEYGTGIVDEDLDEYGNPVFNVLNAVGNTIRKAIHYKTDTKCKVVTDLAICKETVYLTNSAEEDT